MDLLHFLAVFGLCFMAYVISLQLGGRSLTDTCQDKRVEGLSDVWSVGGPTDGAHKGIGARAFGEVETYCSGAGWRPAHLPRGSALTIRGLTDIAVLT